MPRAQCAGSSDVDRAHHFCLALLCVVSQGWLRAARKEAELKHFDRVVAELDPALVC